MASWFAPLLQLKQALWLTLRLPQDTPSEQEVQGKLKAWLFTSDRRGGWNEDMGIFQIIIVRC